MKSKASTSKAAIAATARTNEIKFNLVAKSVGKASVGRRETARFREEPKTNL